MYLEAALLERKGIKHARHTMRDGFAGDVIDVEAGQQDTDGGKDEIEQVTLLDVETAGKEARNEGDEGLEQHGSKSRRDAHDEGEQHNKGLEGNVLFTPNEQSFPPSATIVVRLVG